MLLLSVGRHRLHVGIDMQLFSQHPVGVRSRALQAANGVQLLYSDKFGWFGSQSVHDVAMCGLVRGSLSDLEVVSNIRGDWVEFCSQEDTGVF